MLSFSPQWLAVIISVLVMLGGTAVNLFIIGRFVGQWSETMRNLNSTLTEVRDDVGVLQDDTGDHTGKIALLDQRMLVVEAATRRFDSMRDEFIAMKTMVEMNGKRTEERLDSFVRAMHGVERQLGNLMNTRPALMLQTSPDQSSEPG